MSLTPRLDKLDKNYLINGGMDFHQRLGIGNAANLTGSNAYYADRWLSSYAGSWTGTPQIASTYTGFTPNTKSLYSLNTYGQAVNSSSSLTVGQRIESIFGRELANETCSMSWWVKCSIGFVSSAIVNFYYLATPDSPGSATLFHTETVNFTADATWREIKVENIAFPNGCEGGVTVEVIYSGATDFSSTLGMLTTQYCLNIGPKAIDFTRAGRTWADELALCQRYFEKSWDLGTGVGAATYTGANVFTSFNNQFSPQITFKVRKRAVGSYQVYNGGSGTAGSIIAYGGGSYACSVSTTGEASMMIASGVAIPNTNIYYAHWSADGEL